MSENNILAIIPARGGSKGVPRKNIKELSGIPLLAHTSTAALNSRYISRAVLSTEDIEIASIGKQLGIEVPFLRPDFLAQDKSPSLSVIQFTLNELEDREGYVPDIVVILQPTSPFRTAAHIDEAIQRYIQSGADGLVSVVKIPHNMSPVSAMMKCPEGYLESLIAVDELINLRQLKPVYYARNGAAIYITSPKNILENNSLFGQKIVGYEMSKLHSIDIDDEDDWAMAEALVKWKKN